MIFLPPFKLYLILHMHNMELNEDQITCIRQDIRNRGVSMDTLADALLDHICCALEAHSGSDFEIAYNEVMQSFGGQGLIHIQDETELLLTIKKEEKMKKTMYVIGFIATFLTSTGLLFKLQYWPGASIMLVLGIALINLGFLPIYFYDRYKRSIAG